MDYIYQFINLVKRWSNYFGLTGKENLEDAFYQLLYQKNYDEALKLALQHKYLNIDLVYQCKWRNSGFTVQSINSILGKIQDKLWAINESVTTVPISYEACRTLIEFGLREANLRLLHQLGNEPMATITTTDKKDDNKKRIKKEKQMFKLPEDMSDEEIESLIDFENLNDQQKELCRCRQDLIRHDHSLFAYENILGDYRTVQQHFDHVFYHEFRQKCPLNACIDFAHEGDGHAVEILLNFYTEDLTSHLLAILSNFPETLSPYQYRNLLPCLRQGDNSNEIYEWTSTLGQVKRNDEFDWSCRGSGSDNYSSLMITMKKIAQKYEEEFYKDDNIHLKKYLQPYNPKLLTTWFIERALEMESKTSLLSNGIQLLHLGTELNIKNLKETHDDLIEFDKVIYDCCTEDNIYLSYANFNQMDDLKRLILMTGNSIDDIKDRLRFYVVPYIHRREEQLGFDGKAKLLNDYFITLAKTRETICHTAFNDLLNMIECDTFVANWTKDFDDIIDKIGEQIKTIERNRQAKQLTTVATQTLSLGEYNACYDACQLIMKNNFNDCWAICCQLGVHKDYKNFEAKYKLLAFALAHCNDSDGKMSAKILDHVIELRKRDEKLQMAYLESNS